MSNENERFHINPGNKVFNMKLSINVVNLLFNIYWIKCIGLKHNNARCLIIVRNMFHKQCILKTVKGSYVYNYYIKVWCNPAYYHYVTFTGLGTKAVTCPNFSYLINHYYIPVVCKSSIIMSHVVKHKTRIRILIKYHQCQNF